MNEIAEKYKNIGLEICAKERCFGGRAVLQKMKSAINLSGAVLGNKGKNCLIEF